MICCDRCGEWYHGDCVGISVAEGKRMEKSGKEYICIKCNGQCYMHNIMYCKSNLFQVQKFKFTQRLVIRKALSQPYLKKTCLLCAH